MNGKLYISPFYPDNLPQWPCPHCPDGVLLLEENSISIHEINSSIEGRSEEDWEPECITERFSGLLKCNLCEEPVFIVGETKQVEAGSDHNTLEYSSWLIPHFFEPAIQIIKIPKNCTRQIKRELNEICKLYWVSPSSAGNRIRVALELLMDQNKVPKKAKIKTGKYRNLTLHERITKFKSADPDIATTLMALKWLGNAGSHPTNLSHSDVLSALDLLSYVFEEMYERKTSNRRALVKLINKNKGPKKRY